MRQMSNKELAEYLSHQNCEMQLPFMSGYTKDVLIHNEALCRSIASILVVDDEMALGGLLKDYLQMRGFSYTGASNAFEALLRLRKKKIDLVVSDIKMRGKDGIELMHEVHKEHPNMPFIIMTGYSQEYSYEDIINAGATDFIAKPFSLEELNGKILRIAREKDILSKFQQTLIRVKKLFANTVGALASTIGQNDPYTAGHQKRVGHLACAIAQEIGLAVERIEALRLAAFVHDIGKIGVPSGILTKPGKLMEIEMNLIRVHSQIGYNILEGVDFPWPIAEMVLQHHERLNGSGYPRGLVRHEILLEAKIIGVADVIEAVTSHRPYRPAFDLSTALEEIYQNKGVLYDEEIVDACIKLFAEKEFNF
jgi:putative two-component system response regulator